MMCCCLGLGATSSRPFKQMPDCWRLFLNGDKVLDFIYKFPKSGYYVLSIASKNATEQEAHNAKNWLSLYIGYYQKGAKVDIGNWLRNSLASNAINAPENPSVLIRWIGKEADFVPAKTLSLKELRAVDTGIFTRCNVFPDGTDVFANGNRILIPPVGNWAKAPANTAHWHIQDVNLTKAGVYTLYVLGDDEQRVLAGGVPVVWTPNESQSSNLNDCSRTRSQGTFRIRKAGEMQFVIMQVNVPAATPTWTALVLKDPDGEIVDIPHDKWRSMLTILDCADEPIVPTESQINSSTSSAVATAVIDPNGNMVSVNDNRPFAFHRN